MAVSRRLRFEILRRDNHQCRYCGASAPGAKLTVDHVLPTALGGNDDPTNLVTACQPCNAGKAASSPDSALVADVKADAMRWAQAVEIATNARLLDRSARDAYVAELDAAWREWTTEVSVYLAQPTPLHCETWELAVGEEVAKKVSPVAIDIDDGVLHVTTKGVRKWEAYVKKNEDEILRTFNSQLPNVRIGRLAVHVYLGRGATKKERRTLPRPTSWETSIWQFYAEGLPIEELRDAVAIACGNDTVSTDRTWRYFCGVCWRRLEKLREMASDIVTTLNETDGEV